MSELLEKPVRQSGIRDRQIMGVDSVVFMVWIMVCITPVFLMPPSVNVVVGLSVMFIVGVIGLQKITEKDPKMLNVLQRYFLYAPYVPARRTREGEASSKQAVEDILPYDQLIDDGVVLMKDGGYLAGIYYRGRDMHLLSNDERNAIRVVINRTLQELDAGWSIHSEVIRTDATEYPTASDQHMPSWVLRAIESERRGRYQERGAYFVTDYALFFRWTPPARMISHKTLVNEGLQKFNDVVAQVESQLREVVQTQRMKDAQTNNGDNYSVLISALNRCVSSTHHDVRVTENAPITHQLAVPELITGLEPKVSGKLLGVVSVCGFPEVTVQGIIADLDGLPFEYRWSTRFIVISKGEAIAKYKRARTEWKRISWGPKAHATGRYTGHSDSHAVRMQDDANEAMSEVKAGFYKCGSYTSNVIVLADDKHELDEKLEMIETVVRHHGFAAMREKMNAVDAWRGSMPGDVKANVRTTLLNTVDVADLIAMTSVWPGERYAPCPFYEPMSPPLMYAVTDGATPFRINLHHGDTGHTLVTGPTGSGKSVLLGMLIAQFTRYRDAQIFAFDKGRSLYTLTSAAEGAHYSLGETGPLSLCPLSMVKTQKEIMWANAWVQNLCELQGVSPTIEQKKRIADAISVTVTSGRTTLTDLYTNLQDSQLKAAIAPYLVDGRTAGILDGQHDTLESIAITTFEMSVLLEQGDEIVIPVLDYLFYRIQKRLDGRPTLIVLDEAWTMLAHTFFRQRIVQWLRELRKANAVVVLATQHLLELKESGILEVLVQSCTTKIFLANPAANAEIFSDGYRNMGLSTKEIAIISRMRRKREYYYSSDDGSRVFDMALSPFELAIVGVSSPDDVARVRSLQAEHTGEEWIHRWLEEQGVK